jgi:hypothetical protein
MCVLINILNETKLFYVTSLPTKKSWLTLASVDHSSRLLVPIGAKKRVLLSSPHGSYWAILKNDKVCLIRRKVSVIRCWLTTVLLNRLTYRKSRWRWWRIPCSHHRYLYISIDKYYFQVRSKRLLNLKQIMIFYLQNLKVFKSIDQFIIVFTTWRCVNRWYWRMTWCHPEIASSISWVCSRLHTSWCSLILLEYHHRSNSWAFHAYHSQYHIDKVLFFFSQLSSLLFEELFFLLTFNLESVNHIDSGYQLAGRFVSFCFI